MNFILPGEGAAGPIDMVVVFQTGVGSDPIEPGTRVGELTALGPCASGTTAYNRYGDRVQ